MGPGNVDWYIGWMNPMSKEAYWEEIRSIAKILKKNNVELAVLPDKGMYLDLAIEYKHIGGYP